MLERYDQRDERPVSLAAILKVLEYQEYHNRHPLTEPQRNDPSLSSICEWDTAFFAEMEDATLFAVARAALHRKLTDLLSTCMKIIAQRVDEEFFQGGAAAVKERFHLPDNLTDEQKRDMEKQVVERLKSASVNISFCHL